MVLPIRELGVLDRVGQSLPERVHHLARSAVDHLASLGLQRADAFDLAIILGGQLDVVLDAFRCTKHRCPRSKRGHLCFRATSQRCGVQSALLIDQVSDAGEAVRVRIWRPEGCL